MSINSRRIILFDGVCNFCNFWVNFIIDRDKNDKFRFASLQSEASQDLLQQFNLSTTDFDTFILIEGKKYYTKSTAALRIAKHLNFPINILYYFIFVPKFIRDYIYSLVANNRYKFFGKRDTCRIPAEKERQKFL